MKFNKLSLMGFFLLFFLNPKSYSFPAEAQVDLDNLDDDL